jgi:hypothetical protein
MAKAVAMKPNTAAAVAGPQPPIHTEMAMAPSIVAYGVSAPSHGMSAHRSATATAAIAIAPAYLTPTASSVISSLFGKGNYHFGGQVALKLVGSGAAWAPEVCASIGPGPNQRLPVERHAVYTELANLDSEKPPVRGTAKILFEMPQGYIGGAAGLIFAKSRG